MRLFRPLAALLLALVWLPATMHCGLNAAGVFEYADSCCHHPSGTSDAPSHCGADNCELVEGGEYQPSTVLLKAPAPVATVCFSLLIPSATDRSEAAEVEVDAEGESPPEVRRCWHFVVRAALPARAPSVV